MTKDYRVAPMEGAALEKVKQARELVGTAALAKRARVSVESVQRVVAHHEVSGYIRDYLIAAALAIFAELPVIVPIDETPTAPSPSPSLPRKLTVSPMSKGGNGTAPLLPPGALPDEMTVRVHVFVEVTGAAGWVTAEDALAAGLRHLQAQRSGAA